MLKRYFSIGEAASFLTHKEHHLIQEKDIYELACRGDVRLCFWFEGPIYHLTLDIDNPHSGWERKATHSFRGYLQVPQRQLSPAGGTVEVTDACVVEAIGVKEPALPAIPPGDTWNPIVHFGFGEHDRSSKTFRTLEVSVDCEETVVPVADLMRVTKKSSVGASSTSQREHVSDNLARMNQAAEKFWANADRGDRSTHPSNGVVAAWLESQGLSASLAQKAASLIRPDWAPPGRKPGN